jgi:hypothetical protein
MPWKYFLRYFLLTVTGIFASLIIFVAISVGPVDRTPAESFPAYETMMKRLDALTVESADLVTHGGQEGFTVGFSKVNLTPSHPMATAGYGKRRGKPYTNVHDSIFARAVVIKNGLQRVAIVSADLLIMPPAVTKVLDKKLHAIGFSLDNTYLGAIHSHNSIGHWGKGAARFIYGTYEDSVIEFIADRIVKSVAQAQENLLPATLRVGAIAIPEAVENRLIDGGIEDPFLRALEIHRSDSSKAVLISYAAHATCLFQSTIELSRDYPGMLVDALESEDYSFAMFMAGSVGSQKGSSPSDDWDCVKWMAGRIGESFLEHRNTLKPMTDASLFMKRVPFALSDPQVKITEDWKVRSWLFRAAFGEYDSFLTVLRIGDLVMLGTPCDFSGEFDASLDSLAASKGLQAMVTSFNGGYIGYVTPGKYYDVNHYETRLMNWYAPGTGNYMEKCLEKLILAVSDPK